MLHVMPYLSSQGIQRSTSALIAGAVPILGIVGRLGFGWMSDVFNKRFMMALTYVFLSLGMLFFSYAQGTILIILFLLFFAPGLGGSMVMRGAILRGYFGRNSFGKLLGIVMGSGALGGVVGPTLAGFAFDLSGSYHLIWLIFSVLTGFSAILILNIGEDRETQGTD